MRARYEKLKQVALETLAELGYCREGADFDKARYWPYPIVRYQIARELYNLPGASLTSIGRLMGISHCNLSQGLNKINSCLDVRDAHVLQVFKDKIGKMNMHPVDKVWSIDDAHSFLYLMMMEDRNKPLLSDGILDWYTENDDLAQYIMTL